jgi:sec-independent protein translocase protein TatC
LFFFLFGAGFALWSVPLIMNVLKSFAGSDLSYFPIGDQFLGFLLAVMVGYGLIFELPVVLYVLGRLRIISSGWLYKHRMYWLIGMAIAAQLLTPGTDPFTPFLMFIPLMIFWEVTTLLLKMTGR